MITVTKASAGDQAAWETFASAHADHHAFSWNWRTILSSVFGHRPEYLIARNEGGTVTGMAPLFALESPLFGRALISVPYLNGGGILAGDNETFRALLDATDRGARRHGSAYIELRHRTSNNWYPSTAAVRTHKVALRVPLQRDPDELFQRFSAKLRSQIRRPGKSGASTSCSKDLTDFYKVFAENMRDLGTPVYPRKLFEETLTHFGDAARVIIVTLEGAPVAAGITLKFRNSVEIPWASSLRRYNSLSVNMLLYWEAIKQACLDGADYFDFGRSTRDSGTYRFKKQWGPEEVPLAWYYPLHGGTVPDVNPNSPKFRLLVECWKKLPVPMANAIGPWLTKGLP